MRLKRNKGNSVQLVLGIMAMSILIASVGLISQRGVGISQNAFAAGKILYDDFSGAAYTLAEGQMSPNGKWLDVYNGRGSAGVKVDQASGQNVFFEQPKTGNQGSERYGAKVVSTGTFGDASLSMDVRTDKQLRPKNFVQPWDTAWIMFRHADNSNYYYLMLKTNGYELGKKVNDYFYFLQTGDTPHATIGYWQHVDITTIGNKITIAVDGNRIIDFTDADMNPAMNSGAIGLYAANAAASFDNIYATPVTAASDPTAPSIVAPADIVVEARGLLTNIPFLGTPIVYDSIDPAPIVTTNAPAGGFPLGTTIVTWTATDKAGNKASDIQVVTVRDTLIPAIAITSPSSGFYTTDSTILVKGTASDYQSSGVNKVSVTVDLGTPIIAVPIAPGDWSSWTVPVTISASGSHSISTMVEDNAGNTNSKSISISKGTTSSTTAGGSSTNVYDNFEGQTYWLGDGATSPNGKWKDKYNGYGVAGVITDSSGNNVFYAKPQTATGTSTVNADQTTSGTHAALVLSTAKYKDYKLSLDMRTDKQLRAVSPNTWEVAWIMFNYVDSWHHHYFTLKTNGYELGKKDNTCQCEQQIFLKTGTSLKNTIGTWYHVDIYVVGNHITVYVDNNKIIDMYDTTMSSYFNNGGSIGLYTEDAEVRYDNVSVTPL